MAYNVIVGIQGTGFDLLYDGKRYLGCWSPLLGKHNLYAILFALAVAVVHAGIRVEDALQAITSLEPLPGRMQPILGINNSLIVDDSHRSNTESMLAALDWLGSVRDTRGSVYAILGEFDAQGEYRSQGPRLIGQKSPTAWTRSSHTVLPRRPSAEAPLSGASINSRFTTRTAPSAR
ncbi:MAG: hypothetical protein HND48_08740 [Chloroflexi bacterium]|nr:hypothetical protein [Chloroflexota bacterium]